jgi:hypothetical protein
MDKNAKIFCVGSNELLKVGRDLEAKEIHTGWTHPESFNDPNLLFAIQYGYLVCYPVKYREILKRDGFLEVNASAIKEYFDPKPVFHKHLCCFSGPNLSRAVKDLTSRYDFDIVSNGTAQFCYTFKHIDGRWRFVVSSNCIRTKSVQEFIDYWKEILPKRGQESDKKESVEPESYIGFRGDLNIMRGLLPMGLEVNYNLRDTSRIFYYSKEKDFEGKTIHKIDWCLPGTTRAKQVKILDFEIFCGKINLEMTMDTILSTSILNPATQRTPIKPSVLSQEIFPAPSFELSEKKSLKIVL